MHTRISGKIIDREDPHACATKHLCKDSQAFGKLGSYNIPINVANGDTVRSSGIGSLTLALKTREDDIEDFKRHKLSMCLH